MKTAKTRLIPPLLALAFLSAPPQTQGAPLNLPEMGDPSATLLSAEEDRALGQAFMRNLRSRVEIIESPEINAYVNALGYRLLSSAGSELPFTFFVVDDANINAFAGPGGYIGIHTGLILAAESEGELAAVMAHEIAHVTQRHLARAVQKSSFGNIQTLAALLAAIIAGQPEVAQAAIALNIQQQLNFTREHEREADRVGIETLAQAGFDPRQMPAFFNRLQQSTRYMESSLPELLRTHPVTPARIADSSNRAEQHPRIEPGDNGDFELIKALVRTLHNDRQQRLKTLDAVEKPALAQIYEQALWQLDGANLQQAEKLSERLLERHPEKELFIALQAKIELQQGKVEEAERRLTAALKLYPGQPLLTVLQANARLQLGRADESATSLRQLIAQQGRFLLPSYYQLLARAEAAAGRENDAYQAMADYYYLTGHTRSAVEQLKMALEHTGNEDSFRRQRIETRLEEWQRELLEQERREETTQNRK